MDFEIGILVLLGITWVRPSKAGISGQFQEQYGYL